MSPRPIATARTDRADQRVGQAIRKLEIYVSEHCENCNVARRMVAIIEQWAIVGLETRIVDLESPGSAKPDAVFAVPTYLLDGRIVSLGNPDEVWLKEQLESAAAS